MTKEEDKPPRSSTLSRAGCAQIMNSRRRHSSSSLIDAAALQDHLASRLNLKWTLPKNKMILSKPRASTLRHLRKNNQTGDHEPRRTAKTSIIDGRRSTTTSFKKTPMQTLAHTSLSLVLTTIVPESPPQQEEEVPSKWTCDRCTFENQTNRSDGRCTMCDGDAPDDDDRESEENQRRRPRLTLAQQRGLVPAPTPALTVGDWQACLAKAAPRCQAREPCAICQSPFGLESQVLLSCGHGFHHQCLVSFEQFLRTKDRTCPLCRQRNYQKKRTELSSDAKVNYALGVIQTQVRRFLHRRAYHRALLEYYQQGRGEESQRRAFFAQRLECASAKWRHAIAREQVSMDSLFSEWNNSLRQSRQIFSATMMTQSVDWHALMREFHARDESECPICMTDLLWSGDTTKKESSSMILSCSHVFHHACLSAFEDFNIYEVNLCPVCRQSYVAQSFNMTTLKRS